MTNKKSKSRRVIKSLNYLRNVVFSPLFIRYYKINKNKINQYSLFTLGSVYSTNALVRPSKQLKQIIQIEHNIVKNPNWPEANQLAIYKRDRGKNIYNNLSTQEFTATTRKLTHTNTHTQYTVSTCFPGSCKRLHLMLVQVHIKHSNA